MQEIVSTSLFWKVAALVIPAAAAIVGIAAKAYLPAFINARVDERVKTRLADYQHDLNKELETHKTALSVQTETLRGLLQRSAADFGIYAERRHSAITSYFEELLKAEVESNDRSGPDGGRSFPDRLSQGNLETSRVIAARNSAYEAFYQNVLYLPPLVLDAAAEARDAFHDLLVEYISASDRAHSDQNKARTVLRQKLEVLQSVSRADLSSSAISG